MPAYRVTIDKEACDGIFACLTRDPRFVEDEDGLATLDPDADPIYDGGGSVWRTEGGAVVAEFDDDRAAEARQAAEACPPGAITVEKVAHAGEFDGVDVKADGGAPDQ